MTVQERAPITANESEKLTLNKLKEILNDVEGTPKLVGPQGEEIELSVSVLRVMRQVVYHMTLDRAISIIPINKELTTQEAADILRVSRPYLIKVLEEGKIPFTYVGTHRRVRLCDLLDYKQRRHEERLRALAEIAHISEDAGLYD